MDKDKIIQETADYVRQKFESDSSGHDWWHMYRVWKLASRIAKAEGANLFIVELAALLHDIADYKFHAGDDKIGAKVAREWLEKMQLDENDIGKITDIVEHVSFKGAGVKSAIDTVEGQSVQDADRIDALGAIGIARVFAYSGKHEREMYNPAIKVKQHKTFEEYKKRDGTTINHFYEKLLLLKDQLHTRSAKKIAQGRHKYMEDFLDRFYAEWEGEA